MLFHPSPLHGRNAKTPRYFYIYDGMNAIVKQYMAVTTGVRASGRGQPSQWLGGEKHLEALILMRGCVHLFSTWCLSLGEADSWVCCRSGCPGTGS